MINSCVSQLFKNYLSLQLIHKEKTPKNAANRARRGKKFLDSRGGLEGKLMLNSLTISAWCLQNAPLSPMGQVQTPVSEYTSYMVPLK
jgi:hypothetical protein